MVKPQRFGQYDLYDRLGLGGMAEVFYAMRVGGGSRSVALKRILRQYSGDREFVLMFIDEAKISAQLDHPNIVRVVEFGDVDGWQFIALEYVHGQHLGKVRDHFKTSGHPMPLSMVLYITQQIGEALAYAHTRCDTSGESMHLVHRDVNPKNVLISFTGEVKLIDFGIAKARTRLARTMGGAVKGKFAYMSPQQVVGGDLDHRSDIFSLGIVLHELLTNSDLFAGENDFNTMDNVVHGEIPSPLQLNPLVPKALETVVSRALARQPQERYQSMHAMLADLERATSDVPELMNARTLSAWLKTAFSEDYEGTTGIETLMDDEHVRVETHAIAGALADGLSDPSLEISYGSDEDDEETSADLQLPQMDGELAWPESGTGLDDCETDQTPLPSSLRQIKTQVTLNDDDDNNNNGGEGELDEAIVALISQDRARIPPYPAAAEQISRLIGSQNYGMKELTQIIGADQYLAASVLRRANSAAYGGAVISSLEQAVTRIGTRELVNLVMALGLGQMVASAGPLLQIKHLVWRHAIISAEICRRLAGLRNLPVDEAFVAGLLHDFGKVIAIGCIEEIIEGDPNAAPRPVHDWMKVVERYHLELGLVMVEKWKLPAMIREVVSGHHLRPSKSEFGEFTQLTAASDDVIEILDRQPAVAAVDLSPLNSLRDARECQAVAEFLPRIPDAIQSLGLPSPFAPARRSRVSQPHSTLMGRQRSISFEASGLGSASGQRYQAQYLSPDGLGLMGTTFVQENTLIQLMLSSPVGGFELWGTVTLCAEANGGYRIEVQPMALDGEAKQKWRLLWEAAVDEGGDEGEGLEPI